MHNNQWLLEPGGAADISVTCHARTAGNIGMEPIELKPERVNGVHNGVHLDLEDFFENGAIALHLVAGNGTILKANKAELDLLGYDEDDYVGRHIAEFHADQSTIDEILERLTRGEKIDKFPARLRAKDGSIKDVQITSSAQFCDGKFVNTRCFTVDVTELKRVQDRLRESEEHLRQILEALPAAVYTTDANGVITYYNPAAVELAGRTPEIGKDEWCVSWRILTPDGHYLPHDQCPMAVALRENRPVRGVEAIAERPDGTRVPFLPFPTPLKDSSGRLVGAINMLVDVTERKEAEHRQQLLLYELNHRVKNNLQMLQGLLSTAGREAKNAEARSTLSDAAQRIAAIAAAQKVLYTTQTGTVFNAADFLQAVSESSRQSFAKEVRVELTTDVGQLNNDIAMPLALILNELLTNAVKHGINGGGGGTVHVELREDDEALVLRVRDHGPGFNLQTSSARSSGLGLVMGLAHQAGGRFDVSSVDGACCSVRLPVQNRV
jgi:PAS domain S-box-containing protein